MTDNDSASPQGRMDTGERETCEHEDCFVCQQRYIPNGVICDKCVAEMRQEIDEILELLQWKTPKASQP